MYIPSSTATSVVAALSQTRSNIIRQDSPSSIPTLHSLTISTTPNGFNDPPRGWNSFGVQANPSTVPSFVFDQEHVLQQCDVLASNPALRSNGFTYCSIDSGWSQSDHGDDNGRILPNSTLFPGIATGDMANHLHSAGLQLGVYVVPGGFLQDVNKTILNTDVKIGDVCSGDNGLLRCNWDYTVDAVQAWHDSVVAQFANWGVDFIKLDFVTPGSPDNGVNLPANESLAVVAYHTAISRSGRPMRLDISWKLSRSMDDFNIWDSNADSFRTDQDINNVTPADATNANFTSWATVQRAIDNYRQYITLHTGQDEVLTVYPDMDNMFIVNPQQTSGITDEQRRSVVSHWIGAASNLILGSDLTNIDDFGQSLLSNNFVFSTAAGFTATHPMVPRNPGTGGGDAKQLQAWIAGPSNTSPSSENSTAIVLLANYGPDLGQGGFNTTSSGVQTVSISLAQLGIAGDKGDAKWTVKDAWTGQDLGVLGPESVQTASMDSRVAVGIDGGNALSANLDEGQTSLLVLTKAN